MVGLYGEGIAQAGSSFRPVFFSDCGVSLAHQEEVGVGVKHRVVYFLGIHGRHTSK